MTTCLEKCTIITDEILTELMELYSFCLVNDLKVSEDNFKMGGRFQLGDKLDKSQGKLYDLAQSYFKKKNYPITLSFF